MSNANEWPIVKLGEVAEVLSGGTPKTSEPTFWDGNVPWITPADMSKNSGLTISQGQRSISEDGLKRSSAVLIPAGSVVLSSRAPIGYVAVNTRPLTTNQGCKSFVPGDELDAGYLAHYLTHIREQLQQMGTGATFKELSRSRALEIPVPLPPLAEQQRIAEILDLTSTITHQVEKQLSLLANVSMSYANSCLVSERTSPLSEFGTFSGGMTPSKKNSEYWGGTVRWFTTKDLKKSVLKDSIDHVTEQALEGTSLKCIPSPSIAFSLRGMSLAHTVPMSRIPSDSAVNQDLKAFVPHNPDGIRVLYALIKAKSPWLLSKVSTSGHGTKKLDFAHLQNLELPQLSAEDLAQLDQVLIQIEELEQRKTKELEALKSLHHSLSTRAFAGQL